MAIIKNKETSLDKKSFRDLFIELLALIICVASIPIYMYTKNLYISAAVMIVFAVTVLHLHKQRKIYRAGISGEKTVAKLLERLDNNYLVYNDIIIGGKEKGAQIDHLVLSPYGLFCIETKNMKGTIIGKERDNNWVQKKIGQGGKTFEKQFYNPCKQSHGHVNAIKNLLRHKDFENIWVQSVVVFSSETVSLRLELENTPVFTANKLLNYFENRKEVVISKEKLKRIENIVDKNIL